MFYVYIHRKKTNRQIFYVGKGQGERAWWVYGRSEYWQRVKSKYGLIVEILKDGLSEEEAHKLEIETIKKIGRHNLCNHTDGGEGMSGWVASEETRKKLSKIRKGRVFGLEARMNMSKARKGVPKSKDHVAKVAESLRGRRFSEEHRKNLSESIKKREVNPEWGKKSGRSRMKRVLCINSMKEYESTKHAARDLDLDSGSISRVCNGKYKHTNGYIFRYVDHEDS